VSEAPDYVAPVEGWRLWLVVGRGESLRLASVVHTVVWLPGEPLDARCLVWHRRLSRPWRRERPSHPVPESSCRCGIYAIDDPSRLGPYLDGTFSGRCSLHRVVGRVSLWGDVVECERGWRASRAYPAHLYVPPLDHVGGQRPEMVAEELTDYGVPVDVLSQHASPEVLGALAEVRT
jgi:hypothetical protein